MSTRRRSFDCDIAGKSVTIALRPGGGTQEPSHMYVRCEERDCQYVDLNVAPCPLRASMFDDGSERRVGAYVEANAGTRVCYSCLTTSLSLTHDQVRQAAWRLREMPAITIRPARCGACRRRGVTIGLARDAKIAWPRSPNGAEPSPTVHAAPKAPAVEVGVRRVIEFLGQTPGEAFCASCIALSTGESLSETRRLVQSLRDVPEFEQRQDACSACGRLQPVVRTWRASPVAAPHGAGTGDVMPVVVHHRGCRIELLSFRTAAGWRPLAIVKSEIAAMMADPAAIVCGLTGTKHAADELAAVEARAWVDKRLPD